MAKFFSSIVRANLTLNVMTLTSSGSKLWEPACFSSYQWMCNEAKTWNPFPGLSLLRCFPPRVCDDIWIEKTTGPVPGINYWFDKQVEYHRLPLFKFTIPYPLYRILSIPLPLAAIIYHHGKYLLRNCTFYAYLKSQNFATFARHGKILQMSGIKETSGRKLRLHALRILFILLHRLAYLT